MITERGWVKEFWDPERNKCDIRKLEGFRPDTPKKFCFKCLDCGYRFPKPICPRDISGVLLCPNCGEGRSREVTQENCLAATHPQIAGELADELNGGITGRTIRSTYRDHPLYFRCGRGHVYPAYVDNRARRGDGCPVCSRQKKTSFIEQAILFYIRKCSRNARNGVGVYGFSADILLEDRKIAVMYDSKYYHCTVKSMKEKEALEKAKKMYLKMAQYFRVYVLTDWEEEAEILKKLASPLIIPMVVPCWSYSQKKFGSYNQKIYRLLQDIFPENDSYPNIDIQRDERKILEQYIKAPVKNSFQGLYPDLAKDWDWEQNGSLTPDMFPANSPHRFYFICRTCGRSYLMSISNRRKVKPDTCPACCRKSKYPSTLLCESYPELRHFWNQLLNEIPIERVAVASEKTGIFDGPNGKIVSIQICRFSQWLWKHPDERPENYIRLELERQEKRWGEEREKI